MYIFKQPGIGGEVVAHQDSTFLYTKPMTTTGFWVPLQDCTLQNGCLWAIPGSHSNGLHNERRFVRKEAALVETMFTAEAPLYSDDDFVPVEAPEGALVLIHGELVHRSAANHSSKPRHAYTFHLIESGAEYDMVNWLQPSEELAFPSLFHHAEELSGHTHRNDPLLS